MSFPFSRVTRSLPRYQVTTPVELTIGEEYQRFFIASERRSMLVFSRLKETSLRATVSQGVLVPSFELARTVAAELPGAARSFFKILTAVRFATAATTRIFDLPEEPNFLDFAVGIVPSNFHTTSLTSTGSRTPYNFIQVTQ